jgi:hypothetical protein
MVTDALFARSHVTDSLFVPQPLNRICSANLLGKSLPFDLADDDDLCRDLDIYDFMPQTVSSLEKLLLDPSKMKASHLKRCDFRL